MSIISRLRKDHRVEAELLAQRLLKNMYQWVCWRYEEVDTNGKQAKVPYGALTGRRARINDSATWASYAHAESAFVANMGTYDGLGFVFAGRGIMGIDLDHCVSDETGKIDTWAKRVLDRVNSYAEFSPSRTGIHIFMYGSVPGQRGCKRAIRCKDADERGAIEMYDRQRYFTYTGHHVPGTSVTINKSQDAVNTLHAWITDSAWQRERQPHNAGHPPVDTLSDNELIDRAMRANNGQRFALLWSGSTEQHGWDWSKADMALCAMLAYWTGKNAEQMDRLFRRSGLWRPKWDELRGNRTYGEMTIERALRGK